MMHMSHADKLNYISKLEKAVRTIHQDIKKMLKVGKGSSSQQGQRKICSFFKK